jgi:hypothetical protein
MAEKLRLQNALRQKQKSALRRERQINFFGNKGAVMIGLYSHQPSQAGSEASHNS